MTWLLGLHLPIQSMYITTFYSCDFDYRPCLGVLDTTCSVTPTTKMGTTILLIILLKVRGVKRP